MSEVINENTKPRTDLKCLSIGDVWEEAKYLARQKDRSVSSYIREVIKKQYKQERRKELTSVD